MDFWLPGSGDALWMRRVFGCGLQPLRRLPLAASFSPTLSDKKDSGRSACSAQALRSFVPCARSPSLFDTRPPPLSDAPTVPLGRSLSRGLQWQPAVKAHITGEESRTVPSRQLAQAARQRVPAPSLVACGQPCLISVHSRCRNGNDAFRDTPAVMPCCRLC